MKVQVKLNTKTETYSKAQTGLQLIKEAVMELIASNPEGIKNAETARALGLQSEYGGAAQDYLSYSILGLLMKEGKVKRNPDKKHILA